MNTTKPTYIAPPEIEKGLKQRATRRRQALVAAGCATYEIGRRGNVLSIACLCCGLGSHHPNDIERKYCGFCQEFHTEWKPE